MLRSNVNNPIELNRYGYSLENPINFRDPSGRSVGEGSLIYQKITIQDLPILIELSFALACLVALDVSVIISATGGDPDVVPSPCKIKNEEPKELWCPAELYLWRDTYLPETSQSVVFEVTIVAPEGEQITGAWGLITWNNQDTQKIGRINVEIVPETPKNIVSTEVRDTAGWYGFIYAGINGQARLTSGKFCKFDSFWENTIYPPWNA